MYLNNYILLHRMIQYNLVVHIALKMEKNTIDLSILHDFQLILNFSDDSCSKGFKNAWVLIFEQKLINIFFPVLSSLCMTRKRNKE